MVEEETPNQILCVSFNQDNSCFAVGTETGYRIYSSYPFSDSVGKDMEGGIGLIEMYNRSNIVTLVGGGAKPRFPPNKVIMWDEMENKMVSELRFPTAVQNIKIVSEQLFIVCELKIYIFNFATLEKVDTIETISNPKGLICVSLYDNHHAVGYLDKPKGMVTIKFYDKKTEPISITAHQSEIGHIAMNLDGTLLATTSFKGRMIRVFNIHTKALIYEARRGLERAEIYSLCFDPLSHFLACSSDRKTIHIYKLTNNLDVYQIAPEEKEAEGDVSPTKKGFSAFFERLSQKITKKKSKAITSCFASLIQANKQTVVSMGIDNMLHIVCKEGKYILATFDGEKGGNCTQIDDYTLKIE